MEHPKRNAANSSLDKCDEDDRRQAKKGRADYETTRRLEMDDESHYGGEEGGEGFPNDDAQGDNLLMFIDDLENMIVSQEEEEDILEWKWWERELVKDIDGSSQSGSLDFAGSLKAREMVMVEEPPEVLMPLLPYQKEWLWWALKQEASKTRGGILADEMGMGKTIQAISLILASRGLQRSKQGNRKEIEDANRRTVRQLTGTLVICPQSALTQWKNEIASSTKNGSVQVLLYHGPKRVAYLDKLHQYDIVLTTYATLQADLKATIIPAEFCGRPMLEANPQGHHQAHNCGPGPETQAILANQQVKMSFYQDGPQRPQEPHTLQLVRWERIVLDEAHTIKNSKSNTAKAIFSLQSNFKWALSGAPIQNGIGDLCSLIRFLMITPFSYFFCEVCNCKFLDYKFACDSTKCNCGHMSSRHFCWWSKYITVPIQDNGYSGEGYQALKLLKDKVIDSILLRRTKSECASDLGLPPCTKILRRDTFDAREEDFYHALSTQSRCQVNGYVSSGTLINNYTHVFDLLMRLRQAVDHPYLVIYSKTASAMCGICKDILEEPVMASCSHLFCKLCVQDLPDSTLCPVCRTFLVVDLEQNQVKQMETKQKKSILDHIDKIESFQTSTKIDALMEEVELMIQRDCAAKAIVFSQFTSFLDLIAYHLDKCGISCVKLDGRMSVSARNTTINKFKDDANCKLFLSTLNVGGADLNLTVASNVFLMDPWWNPAIEQLAEHRIHRIGQYKPMRVVRFVIENTVEERILKLQEKKQLVFDGTVGGSKDALKSLTMNDLRFLFAS